MVIDKSMLILNFSENFLYNYLHSLSGLQWKAWKTQGNPFLKWGMRSRKKKTPR